MSILKKTIVLVEDKRFYYHPGFDPIAICRAAWTNFKAGKRVQGGSTITQQLARTLYLDNRKTIWRKLKEICIAIALELAFSKEEILDMYIENIYMGEMGSLPGGKGMHLAARHYFHKPLHGLNIAQQAALVAMIKGPNRYKPNMKAGLCRTGDVIVSMEEANIINIQEAVMALRVIYNGELA